MSCPSEHEGIMWLESIQQGFGSLAGDQGRDHSNRYANRDESYRFTHNRGEITRPRRTERDFGRFLFRFF